MSLTIQEIETRLKKMGFNRFKVKTSKRISILSNDRMTDLRKIEAEFWDQNAKYNAEYKTPIVNGRGGNQVSSIGVVEVGDKIVFANPASRQGTKSAGIENEDNFVNGINKYLDQAYGAFYTITIVLKAPGKEIKIPQALIAESAGTDTAGRKKSDVNILTLSGDTFRVSLKKANAEFWESADKIYGAQAKNMLLELNRRGLIELGRDAKGTTLGKGVSGVAMQTSDAEATNFVFGSDILGQGCVLKQTFTSSTSPSFSFDEKTNTLTITAKNIYQTLGDLRNTTEEPYILIRRDSSRTAGLAGDKMFSGLRVQAVYKARISGGVKSFTRNQFSGIL